MRSVLVLVLEGLALVLVLVLVLEGLVLVLVLVLVGLVLVLVLVLGGSVLVNITDIWTTLQDILSHFSSFSDHRRMKLKTRTHIWAHQYRNYTVEPSILKCPTYASPTLCTLICLLCCIRDMDN